jgi:hypothetical protein
MIEADRILDAFRLGARGVSGNVVSYGAVCEIFKTLPVEFVSRFETRIKKYAALVQDLR